MEEKIFCSTYLDLIRRENHQLLSAGGDSGNLDDPIIEQSMAAFTSQFVVSGTSSSRVIKVIEGVEHFEIVVYFSCNFDCTVGYDFGVRYNSNTRSFPYEAVVDSVTYIPGYTVKDVTPYYDDYYGKRILGLYTMKIVCYVPYVAPFKTDCFVKGWTNIATGGEPFYKDNLTSSQLGTLRVGDKVVTGYNGVTTTNISGESLTPGQITTSALYSNQVSLSSSASRLVATNSDGVYELRN